MLIACPDCHAGYEVPDALLANARMMRCAACGHDWMTEIVAPESKSEPQPEPKPEMALEQRGASPGSPAASASGPAIEFVSCPACDAVYEIPAVMLTIPRMMRCAACGHDWETQPQGAAPSVAASPSAPVVPVETPPQTTEPQPAEVTGAAPPAEEIAPLAATAAAPEMAEPALDVDAGQAEPSLAEILAMPDVVTTAEPAPELPPPSLGERFRRNRIALSGWVVTLAVLYFASQALLNNRDAITEVWPPSQRVILWLGLG